MVIFGGGTWRQRVFRAGVVIAPDQDDGLILAVTVCIDQMTHDVG